MLRVCVYLRVKGALWIECKYAVKLSVCDLNALEASRNVSSVRHQQYGVHELTKRVITLNTNLG